MSSGLLPNVDPDHSGAAPIKVHVVCRSIHFGDGTGGLERAVARQVDSALQRGVQVALYAPNLSGDRPTGVEFVPVEWPRWQRQLGAAGFGVAYMQWCRKVADSVRAGFTHGDVLHLHGAAAGVLAALPPEFGAAALVNPHGMEEFAKVGVVRESNRVPMRRLARSGAARARLICVTDESMTAVTKTNLRVRPSKIVGIPNAVDTDQLRSIAETGDVDRPTGIYVVSVGRMNSNKGFATAAAALRRLEDSGVLCGPVTWEHFGDGPEASRIDDIASRFSTVDYRHTRGAGDADVQRALASADLVLIPSLYEGSSLVALEAMTHGAVVVATPVGGLPDKIEDGVTGYLCSGTAPDDIADGVARALADRKRWPDVSLAAAALVEDRFDVQAETDAHLAVYGRLSRLTAGSSVSDISAAGASGPLSPNTQKPLVVILSTADFDAPLWTNKQHLAVRLAERYEVVFINSLGLRRPRLTRSDVRRVGRRLAGIPRRLGMHRGEEAGAAPAPPPEVRVVAPRVLPLHDLAPVRWLNGQLFRRQFARLIEGVEGVVLWTFTPLTYGVEQLADKLVYHSVDLMHEFPGIARAVLRSERSIVHRADALIASSSGVREHLVSIGAPDDPLLWENVADVERFVTAASGAARRRPAALFAGNLTPSKIDFSLLERVADTGVELVLAGPSSIDGTGESPALDALRRRPNVTFLGTLDVAELARVCNECTVGLIPYRLDGYNRGVFPMKLYEYLAAGLSVVSTSLPSLKAVDAPGFLWCDDDEFTAAVASNIAVLDDRELQHRRHGAARRSWARRGAQADALIRALTDA